YLDIGAARERRIDAQHDLPARRLWHRQHLVAEIPGPVEDDRPHGAHGVTYTFSASRRRMSSTPSASCSSGMPGTTSPSTSTLPAAMSQKARASVAGDDEYVVVRVSSRW